MRGADPPPGRGPGITDAYVGPERPHRISRASYMGDLSDAKVNLLDGFDREEILAEARASPDARFNPNEPPRSTREQDIPVPHQQLFQLDKGQGGPGRSGGR